MTVHTKTIGIWGTARAGKTTYLVMLYDALLSRTDGWSIHPMDDKSRRFIENAFESIMDKHTFPQNTTGINWYAFDIHRRESSPGARDDLQLTINFLDAPGELFEQYYNREQRDRPAHIRTGDASQLKDTQKQTPQVLFEFLMDCDALMIFLDPLWSRQDQQKRSYNRMLYQLFEDVRLHHRSAEGGTVPTQFALCVTKVDGSDDLWQKRSIDADECVRAPHVASDYYCRTRCAVFNELEAHFMVNQLPGLLSEIPGVSMRCFPISSIGRVPNTSQHGDDPPPAQTPDLEKLNVGLGRQWSRPRTPTPPVFKTPQHQGSVDPITYELDESQVEPVFDPNTINAVNDIHPYGIVEPIQWILKNRR